MGVLGESVTGVELGLRLITGLILHTSRIACISCGRKFDTPRLTPASSPSSTRSSRIFHPSPILPCSNTYGLCTSRTSGLKPRLSKVDWTADRMASGVVAFTVVSATLADGVASVKMDRPRSSHPCCQILASADILIIVRTKLTFRRHKHLVPLEPRLSDTLPNGRFSVIQLSSV